MALTRKQLARLGELLDQSLPLPLEERRAWLETLPVDDEPLRQTLSEALLGEDPVPLADPLLERRPRATEHRIGERLGAYELLEPIGAGGMAEVWLARRADGAFDRRVALKIPRLGQLPAEMSARFARECHILASLEIPGVARLYDAGVSEQGVPYIAMEYVAGEPLARYCESRDLDVAARIALFLQVLEAVGRAHARHVIHRDLKPSNILATPDGEVRLLDFGVARLLQGEPEGASLTQAWGPALTPSYASPEMLRGTSVDARSDIYSLGVVLQELLGEAPAALRDVLGKALAQSPDDRYADVTAFAAALRPFAGAGQDAPHPRRRGLRLLLAASVAAVLVSIGFMLRERPATVPAAAAPAREVSMAVLPFADLSPARDQEYLSEGMADEIINQLTQVPSMRLVGLRSSLTFKGRNEDLRIIGEKLGVDHLLDGTIRKDGDRLRITAQLVRARDGMPLWSSAYDRELSDVFSLQEEIARDVARALSVKLDVGPMSRAEGGTTNLDAYDRYLRWRQIFLAERHAVEDHRQRVRLLREAVQADGQFVMAWGELATELDSLAQDLEIPGDQQGTSQAAALRDEAARARARVLELAPESWMGLRIRSEQLANERRWAEAIEVSHRILETGPFTLERAYPYTNVIFAVGHINETVELVDRVIRVEPLAMFPSRDQQWNLTASRRFAEAAAEYRRSRDFDGAHAMPDYIEFLRILADDSSTAAQLRAAHDRYVLGFEGRSTYMNVLTDVLDDRAAMRALVRRLVETGAPRSEYFFGVADAMREPEIALASLRRYLELTRESMDFTRYWELWTTPYSTIRAQPGFKDLLRQAGIVDYWRATGNWGDFCKPVGDDDFECR